MDYPLAFPAQLSQHLRSLRKARGWTQAQLAVRVGVTQSRVSAIEKDATALSTEQLFRWLAALGATLVLRTDDAPRDTVAEPAAPAFGGPPPAGGQW
ncbi:helix-turn-helix transcriptional regulator [Hydrogenophaga pseudoflava]|uniref:helix-turn-helix transcriptional regulator n=1 Tax=Hydrogenophaga pseudoflava TaxID=47421 RepID=UPI0027E4209A|nr:helix-turn-helix domain-containing protein [Hydrogenophaga pseudoflava]MDQ7747468.1 helix-turn-helix domain-containing protein [Hydrogenophaga pseudoflava]